MAAYGGAAKADRTAGLVHRRVCVCVVHCDDAAVRVCACVCVSVYSLRVCVSVLCCAISLIHVSESEREVRDGEESIAQGRSLGLRDLVRGND